MFTLLILSLLFFEATPVYAIDSTIYARVMYSDAYLYKSPVADTDLSNVYFCLPQTYFVELLDSANDEFFKARYNSIVGYVKKSSVQAISGVPLKPTLTGITFRVYAELSRDMRSAPTSDNSMSSQVTYIPLYSQNLTYIAELPGEALVDGRTDVWYYCKYSGDADYYGYVYSDFCDKRTAITLNTEEVSYVANPTFKKDTENAQSIDMENKILPVIVCILSVPAVIFLLLIIKGKNILSKEKVKSKEVVDY